MGSSLKIKFHKETENKKKEREKKYQRFVLKRTGIIIILIAFILFLAYYIICLDFFNLRNKIPSTQTKNDPTSSVSHADSLINLNKTLSDSPKNMEQTIDQAHMNDRFLSEKYILKDTISGYYGISISEWQQTVNWDLLFNKNETPQIKFGIIKATEGANSVDKQFNINWKRAQNPDVNIGAFHFYVLVDDPLKQAENYIRNVKLRDGNIYPIVKIEVNYSRFVNLGIDKVELIKRLTIFLNRLEEQYGVQPILYTCYQFYYDYFKDELSEFKYMFAYYKNLPNRWVLNKESPENQLAPFVFIWQYSYNEKLNGITTTVRMNFIPEEKLNLIILKK